MKVIEVVKANHNVSLQDLGRKSSKQYSISESGVADEHAFLTANQLLGNPANSAALEITFGQATFLVKQPCHIVLTGADCEARVNDTTITTWQVLSVNKGDLITLSRPKYGLYSYLAVAGGLSQNDDNTLWLGSQIARPDKLQSSVIFYSQNSQQILAKSTAIRPKHSNCANYPNYKNNQLVLRFIANQYWRQLTNYQQGSILNQSFTIDANSNKMGIRINSQFEITNAFEQVKSATPTLSVPVTYGTIQLPAASQCIILMKDRQTIGGYPSIGTVMKTDLFRLCQMKNGQQVTLLPISLTQAQTQLNAFYSRFNIT